MTESTLFQRLLVALGLRTRIHDFDHPLDPEHAIDYLPDSPEKELGEFSLWGTAPNVRPGDEIHLKAEPGTETMRLSVKSVAYKAGDPLRFSAWVKRKS